MEEGAEMVSATEQPKTKPKKSIERRTSEVLRIAEALYKERPDWVVFFREIYGAEGVVPRHFNDESELAEFEQSEASVQIQTMITKLRARRDDQSSMREPQRMITVRLPAVVHEALKGEADRLEMSMNQLCISKLMQLLDKELVPARSRSKDKKEKKDEHEDDAIQGSSESV
jgi:predicted HicB family RNase H-like nuclease